MHMHQSNQADTPQTLVEISFENAYESGKTVVHESIDPTPASAALSGAMWAGLFGLILGGPVGWIAGLALGALVVTRVNDSAVP